MNLISVTETKKKLTIKVYYNETDGTQFDMPKEPFGRDAQIRQLGIGLTHIAERIKVRNV